VQPLSQCRVTAHAGVIDWATGARWVILQVARLAWVHAAAMGAVGGGGSANCEVMAATIVIGLWRLS
jgi:hypothetical protein